MRYIYNEPVFFYKEIYKNRKKNKKEPQKLCVVAFFFLSGSSFSLFGNGELESWTKVVQKKNKESLVEYKREI